LVNYLGNDYFRIVNILRHMMDRKLFEELYEGWKKLRWLKREKARLRSEEYLNRYKD
jgi:hypothetical protein